MHMLMLPRKSKFAALQNVVCVSVHMDDSAQHVACGGHITVVICVCEGDRSQWLPTVVIAAQMDVYAEGDQVV